ncbi:hypothetical protein [Paraherbaspirillum soli]|uniref:Uncharacterized protein n=1 Tax=Paraherbaspirillum soli TaxID=631222 RepID=A0ABW0ME67_9BURK
MHLMHPKRRKALRFSALLAVQNLAEQAAADIERRNAMHLKERR